MNIPKFRADLANALIANLWYNPSTGNDIAFQALDKSIDLKTRNTIKLRIRQSRRRNYAMHLQIREWNRMFRLQLLAKKMFRNHE